MGLLSRHHDEQVGGVAGPNGSSAGDVNEA